MRVWGGCVWLSTDIARDGRRGRLSSPGWTGYGATHVGARVSKDDCGAKVDEFDDIATGEDAIVEFEIAMGEARGVEIGDAVANLTEDAEYFWTKHFGRHDDGEEVIRGVFHDLLRVRWSER